MNTTTEKMVQEAVKSLEALNTLNDIDYDLAMREILKRSLGKKLSRGLYVLGQPYSDDDPYVHVSFDAFGVYFSSDAASKAKASHGEEGTYCIVREVEYGFFSPSKTS